MSIGKAWELLGMQEVSDAVAHTLREMVKFAKPGMSTLELDLFGADILKRMGARSAPKVTYNFPGWTCISVNHEFCHGIPSSSRLLKEGDLVNIDVSAELRGFWADNGCSFVLAQDVHRHQPLVEASKDILKSAISHIKDGVRIADIGHHIEKEARKRGFLVIKNLGGHGVGRSLHEKPDALLNYRDPFDRRTFRKNSVVAIETFITDGSTLAKTLSDGWTMVGNRGGYMAQHEHTLMVTEGTPLIFTEKNPVWD